MNPSPQHIAIIMDGNGRWANARGLPRVAGHHQGAEVADHMVTAARDRGIAFLTLYAFSDENWQRPDAEVAQLMELLTEYLASKQDKMIAQGVRLRTIGDTARLPNAVQKNLVRTMEATARGTTLTLTLALSYGARAEICRAVARLHDAGIAHPTPEQLSQHLDTADYPDPDLLIRTSGEYRISNFLLWQLAYTELYFSPVLWPDFTAVHLDEALEIFGQRERRFGRVR